MTIDTQKLLSLFDTAAQAHGWAEDQGTKAQAQTALTNYRLTRKDLVEALEAQAAEIERLRGLLSGVLVDDLVPLLPDEYIAAVQAALSGEGK